MSESSLMNMCKDHGLKNVAQFKNEILNGEVSDNQLYGWLCKKPTIVKLLLTAACLEVCDHKKLKSEGCEECKAELSGKVCKSTDRRLRV